MHHDKGPYAEPYNTPEECDHQSWLVPNPVMGQPPLCTHCCPCITCGGIRASEQKRDGDG